MTSAVPASFASPALFAVGARAAVPAAQAVALLRGVLLQPGLEPGGRLEVDAALLQGLLACVHAQNQQLHQLQRAQVDALTSIDDVTRLAAALPHGALRALLEERVGTLPRPAHGPGEHRFMAVGIEALELRQAIRALQRDAHVVIEKAAL